MAIEGVEEYAEQKKKGLMSEGFHLDAKMENDPAVDRIERLGGIGALKELVGLLEVDPENQDLIRQIKFTVNHLQDTTHH